MSNRLDSKVFKGYASRCTACNAVMNDQRVCFDNGQLDDLCSTCRFHVSKAIVHAEDDIASLPHEKWRATMGESDIFEDVEKQYQGD